jgi:hypothetical protein
MATKAIYIQWGSPFPGRERMALEEFSSYMNWANELKAKGEIERFEVYSPNGGTQQRFTGFTVVEGSESQIDKILKSDDFRMRQNRVMSVCNNLTVHGCDAGTNVGKRLQLYGKSIEKLGL